MDIKKGTKGLDMTFQEDFPKKTQCCCGREAWIAFVAAEEGGAKESEYICNLYENKGRGGFWPHDCIAVAVYFCTNCFKAVTLWNQA